MIRYQMCPECFAVFFPMEGDPMIQVGQHSDKCSRPKCQFYTKSQEEVIKEIEDKKDPYKKYLKTPK